jgi:hypothetical protein
MDVGQPCSKGNRVTATSGPYPAWNFAEKKMREKENLSSVSKAENKRISRAPHTHPDGGREGVCSSPQGDREGWP